MNTGYLAPEGLEEALRRELGGGQQYGRLFVMEGPPVKSHWAQNIWFDVQEIPFQSISEAAKKLRALHGLWVFHPLESIRRGELIREQLPYFSPKPLRFPDPVPAASLGAWTLIDANTMLAAARTSSPFADGEVVFQETKFPPSRAYLKLWEVFTRIGRMPGAGERCLEIGASPGSWTWVLQQAGAEVIAVDRAKLDERIAALPRISFRKGDAFSLTPADFTDIDWVFSDVVCYPARLLEWIRLWLATEANLVCTIKFQGDADYGIIREFESIEGSALMHLSHNKHELTWLRLNRRDRRSSSSMTR